MCVKENKNKFEKNKTIGEAKQSSWEIKKYEGGDKERKEKWQVEGPSRE